MLFFLPENFVKSNRGAYNDAIILTSVQDDFRNFMLIKTKTKKCCSYYLTYILFVYFVCHDQRIRYKNKILISSCANVNYEKKILGVFEIWFFFFLKSWCYYCNHHIYYFMILSFLSLN